MNAFRESGARGSLTVLHVLTCANVGSVNNSRLESERNRDADVANTGSEIGQSQVRNKMNFKSNDYSDSVCVGEGGLH